MKARCSTALLSAAHLGDLDVLGSRLLEDGLMGETRQGRPDVVLLAHLEVLAEVLVTAPPVQVDHAQTLVTSNLMEVSVSHIVLDTVSWESAIAIHATVSLVSLTNSVTPVLYHSFLLVLDHHVEEETAPKMEDDHAPKETHTVLSMEWLHFPVEVAKGVLEEACNILERSESLGIVTGFLRVVNELAEVTIGVLGQGSTNHVGALVDIGHTVEEAFDTSDLLAHYRLGIVPVVEILGHIV